MAQKIFHVLALSALAYSCTDIPPKRQVRDACVESEKTNYLPSSINHQNCIRRCKTLIKAEQARPDASVRDSIKNNYDGCAQICDYDYRSK